MPILRPFSVKILLLTKTTSRDKAGDPSPKKKQEFNSTELWKKNIEKPACLGYIADYTTQLYIYIGTIINHYNNPYYFY